MKKYIVEVKEGCITVEVPFEKKENAVSFANRIEKDGCIAVVTEVEK